VRPINHFSGLQTFYPTFASGKGAAPFKTLEDYEDNLKRHSQLPPVIECSIGRFREGLAPAVIQSGQLEQRLSIDARARGLGFAARQAEPRTRPRRRQTALGRSDLA